MDQQWDHAISAVDTITLDSIISGMKDADLVVVVEGVNSRELAK
jgi:hypothetical protein